MTRNTILQSPGLRILALFSAISITTAFALGSVADVSAQEREGEVASTGWGRHWQAQQGETSRVYLAGVTASEPDEHVDGSGDGQVVSPERTPQPSTGNPVEPAPSAPQPVLTPEPATPAPTSPPVVATPAPTTPPVVAPPVYNGACPALIYNALGVAGCKISFCESGWNANAIGAAGELGWFQVHPRWHSDATLNPAGNVAAAVRISNGGTNWSPWSVRGVLTSGRCPNGTVPPV